MYPFCYYYRFRHCCCPLPLNHCLPHPIRQHRRQVPIDTRPTAWPTCLGCITDAGVERLAALVNLERLYLCRCPALSADAPLRLALCLPSTEVRHRIWPFIYPTPKLGFEYSRFILCGWLLIGCIRYYMRHANKFL